MKIKVNDKVKILAGKDKGKEGIVIKTLAKENKVIVDGINMVKRHQKPRKLIVIRRVLKKKLLKKK